MKVTVAIITKNRETLLAKCLERFVSQTVQPHEILVIDNGSIDNTKKITLSFKNVLPIFYLYDGRTGIPHARNQALQKARGDILAFTDDDCEVSKSWIEEMIIAHRQHPKAVVVQGTSQVYAMSSPIDYCTEKTYQAWIQRNTDSKGHIKAFSTSNASFNMSLVKKHVLSFDERFFRYFRGEDTDIARVIYQKHMYCVLYQGAKVSIKARGTIHGYLIQRWNSGRSKAFSELKWGKEVRVGKPDESYYTFTHVVALRKILLPFIWVTMYVGRKALLLGYMTELAIVTYIDLVGESIFLKSNHLKETVVDFSIRNVLKQGNKNSSYMSHFLMHAIVGYLFRKVIKTYKRDYVAIFDRNDIHGIQVQIRR